MTATSTCRVCGAPLGSGTCMPRVCVHPCAACGHAHDAHDGYASLPAYCRACSTYPTNDAWKHEYQLEHPCLGAGQPSKEQQ